MDNILLMDFELNKPLTLLDKFTKMLKNEGWQIDMFWAKDYINGKKPSLDEKINSSEFILIRKPLTFLNSQMATEKLQKAVLKDNKSLLLMLTFLDRESLDLVRNFLRPFNITPSETKIIDTKINLNNKRSVVYHKKNNCFINDDGLFNRVGKIVIPDTNMLYIDPPAEVLIKGNPSTETILIDSKTEKELKGSDITVGATYNENGRMVVVSSTVFLDNFYDFNKPFIKNIISWLGSEKKSK